MNLVIVESPTKAKTISNFLTKDYLVKSSFGHVRDLPEKSLGIDIENNFKPKYIILPKAKKIIKELKTELQKSNKVILATDEDREGEAIAWHLIKALDIENNNHPKIERIVFHEITKTAIEEALKNPRGIDMNLVNAQQARRILDRLVGYKLSPFLWKKVAKGLSAGRVQSVAVRLIVERQREIDSFKKEEYWTVEAVFKSPKTSEKTKESFNFTAKLIKKDGKIIPKLGIKNKEEAEKIIKDLEGAKYQITDIQKKKITKYPMPPFTTSTLQQEANRRLGFSSKQTMAIAQRLYEMGFITYHRTDSLNLAESFLKKTKFFINKEYGKDYTPKFFFQYKTKSKTAQEAHEAIRPTAPEKKPEELKDKLEKNLLRLYDLIWRRAIASQINPAILSSTTVDIKAKNYLFRSTGSFIEFDGFLKVYPIDLQENPLPQLEKGENLELTKLIPKQHFTKPPAPYTEATLVKTLEQNGIGRPSTYAPIISTIQERNYVKKIKKHLYPTDIGILVNDILVKHFPEIVDIKFTSKMEEDLDKIAQGKKTWLSTVKNFYEPFSKQLEEKYKELDKKSLTEEATNEVCEKCGRPMVVKISKFGKFLACSGFPECKNTKPLKPEKEESIDKKCPKCGGNLKIRKSRFGKFLGCSNYPNCTYTEKITE